MLLQHCKQISPFVPAQKNLKAGTTTPRTTQHTWYYWRNPTGTYPVFYTPRRWMAPFGISSGTVSLSGLPLQKAPSGSQCLQFSENPGQENRSHWISCSAHLSLSPCSLPSLLSQHQSSKIFHQWF